MTILPVCVKLQKDFQITDLPQLGIDRYVPLTCKRKRKRKTINARKNKLRSLKYENSQVIYEHGIHCSQKVKDI